MKTISDIRENVELLHTMDRNARMETEKKYKEKIFAYYSECKEIKEFQEKRENFTDVEYEFDECGDLVSYLEIPKDLKDLPEIKDYLSQDFGYVKNGRLYQFQGDCLCINWHATNREYFIYDTGTRMPILERRPDIEGHPTITEKDYVRAKIELYMRKKGEFGDVVEVDYNGGYDKHFDMKMSYTTDVNLDGPTDEDLNRLVDNYEGNDDDGR